MSGARRDRGARPRRGPEFADVLRSSGGAREALAVGFAAAVHLTFLVLSPKVLRGRPEPPTIPGTPIDAIEVDAVPVPTARAPEPPFEELQEPAIAKANKAEEAPRSPARAKTIAMASPRLERVETPASAEPKRAQEPAQEPPAPDEYGGPPANGGGAMVVAPPGLGGRPVWTLPGTLENPRAPAPAPTGAEPRPSTDPNVASKALTDTLRMKDWELGLELPAGGVVASVLADSVRTSNTPADSRATFEVHLGPRGEVLGVRVVSFSAGSADSWERAAKGAGAALASRTLAMGGEKAGATVVVKVESKQVYPTGKDRVDVKPVCANEVLEEIATALQEVQNGAPPDLEAEERRRRFCVPIGIAGRGDLSNLGAHLQTNVRSTFQVVRPGERKLPSDAALPVEDRAPWLAQRESHAERPVAPPKKKKKKDWERR